MIRRKPLMRSDGDGMVVGIRDAAKLIGISVIACCAVLVCTMFLNYYFDIRLIAPQISSAREVVYYDAQVSTAKVVCLVSGGCLLATSVVMLVFYIRHYIDMHKKELGILKALGYSNLRIAGHFWVFGNGVFVGAALGFVGAFAIIPMFYEMQNKNGILPEVMIHFHPAVPFYFVILPTAAFAALAVFCAFFRLKRPVLTLLKEDLQQARGGRRPGADKSRDDAGRNRPFMEDLKRNTLRSRKILIFFVVFASFCFSAMTQMSASMRELASVMMGAMILLIGMILACTTLFLAITTVIKGNTKTIAMMRVFGYSHKECYRALLGGYRPMACIGFALGTAYQYILLRVMVDIVFKDVEGVPVYEFDLPVMLISLAGFIVIYEAVMYVYSVKIRNISVKEIMLE